MSVKTGMIIFFFSLLTLVIELLLLLGMYASALILGGFDAMPDVIGLFIVLVYITVLVGLLAPFSAFIEAVTKKKKLGIKLLFILTGMGIVIGLLALNYGGFGA